MSLIFKYNNKDYNTLEDAVKNAAIHGYVNSLKEKLEPFESEIIQHGSITFNISDNLDNIQISQENLPEELIIRIQKAIAQ